MFFFFFLHAQTQNLLWDLEFVVEVFQSASMPRQLLKPDPISWFNCTKGRNQIKTSHAVPHREKKRSHPHSGQVSISRTSKHLVSGQNNILFIWKKIGRTLWRETHVIVPLRASRPVVYIVIIMWYSLSRPVQQISHRFDKLHREITWQRDRISNGKLRRKGTD